LQNWTLARYPSIRYLISLRSVIPRAGVSALAAAMGYELEMMPKVSNIVDVYVGARLRMRRTMLGMSQSRLGELLGVTFQQVQKYEKGSNRISASRLQHTARVLEVSPGYFFEGAPADSAEPGFAEESSQSYVVDFLASTEGLQLNRAFLRVSDPKVRRRIVDLVIALASSPEDESVEDPSVR
jgi:transcriptional regulator with XRE-family HTH domain